jgi:hypothetical protein
MRLSDASPRGLGRYSLGPTPVALVVLLVLLAARRTGFCETPGMDMLNDANTSSIGQDAAIAFMNGHRVFVAMLSIASLDEPLTSHEMVAWSDQIMSIEQSGWLLTQESAVGDHRLPKMYCVFHRR